MKSASSPAYALDAQDRPQSGTARSEVSLWRLYLLRAGYLLIAVGMGMQMGSAYLEPHKPWTLTHGVMNAMLLALVLLSILGLCYPLKMLPLLFWEMTWKSIWLLTVALPVWLNHTIDADTGQTTFACLMVAIFYVIVPWDYIFANFAKAPGDRWW